MEKHTRNSRVSMITKILTENPNRIIPLSHFMEMFNAAKSTISEDLLIVRETMEKFNGGLVETIVGASGGVRFKPLVSREEKEMFKKEILGYMMDKNRVVPGNFMYITDIMQNPKIISRAGRILAEAFCDYEPDYIITVETKGIPLAYEVARFLGVQLIVARRNNKITEGTNVSINYLTGTQGLLSTMSLSKRAIRPGSRLIFIDDFLRGGGTVKGIGNLLMEFESTLLAVGVMVDTRDMEKDLDIKLINFIDYYGVDDEGNISVKTSETV